MKLEFADLSIKRNEKSHKNSQLWKTRKVSTYKTTYQLNLLNIKFRLYMFKNVYYGTLLTLLLRYNLKFTERKQREQPQRQKTWRASPMFQVVDPSPPLLLPLLVAPLW